MRAVLPSVGRPSNSATTFPGRRRAVRRGRRVSAPTRPATGPVPGSPEQKVYGSGAQIWPARSVGQLSQLLVLRTGRRMVFAHTFRLTAQGLDGDPIHLLDEFMCYRVEVFQEAGGFIKLRAGRQLLQTAREVTGHG